MDWQLFGVTFSTIFLAELGDKTQLGVLGLTSEARAPGTIFLAASSALVLATLIGVAAGSFLSKFINPKVLRVFGGVLFIAVGIWILIKRD